MAVLEFEFKLRCYNILNSNLLNHIIRSIYEINSYTITERNHLILFLGTIVLSLGIVWNTLADRLGRTVHVNLVFKEVPHRVTTVL